MTTTLWEKVKAEIFQFGNGAGYDFLAFENKLRELFEHHASVDMGKTADIVLATPAEQPMHPCYSPAAAADLSNHSDLPPDAIILDASKVDVTGISIGRTFTTGGTAVNPILTMGTTSTLVQQPLGEASDATLH